MTIKFDRIAEAYDRFELSKLLRSYDGSSEARTALERASAQMSKHNTDLQDALEGLFGDEDRGFRVGLSHFKDLALISQLKSLGIVGFDNVSFYPIASKNAIAPVTDRISCQIKAPFGKLISAIDVFDTKFPDYSLAVFASRWAPGAQDAQDFSLVKIANFDRNQNDFYKLFDQITFFDAFLTDFFKAKGY
jgi:hypothetical protein